MTEVMVEEVRGKALKIINGCSKAVFTTVDGSGFPQSRMMENAGVDDDFTTYFVTERWMGKTRQLNANPRVSIYWVCPENWCNVQIKGTAVLTDDAALKKRLWREDLLSYFPLGIDDPRFVIIVVKPYLVEYADEADGKSENLI